MARKRYYRTMCDLPLKYCCLQNPKKSGQATLLLKCPNSKCPAPFQVGIGMHTCKYRCRGLKRTVCHITDASALSTYFKWTGKFSSGVAYAPSQTIFDLTRTLRAGESARVIVVLPFRESHRASIVKLLVQHTEDKNLGLFADQDICKDCDVAWYYGCIWDGNGTSEYTMRIKGSRGTRIYDGLYGGAASLINHSCSAEDINVEFSEFDIEYAVAVEAIRDIERGDELIVSYLTADELKLPVDERAKLLGFTCGCTRCNLERGGGRLLRSRRM